MPVDFLTEAERERWQRLPDTMPQDDLFVFFLFFTCVIALRDQNG